MVQILPSVDRGPSFGQRLNAGIGNALGIAEQFQQQMLQQEQKKQENAALKQMGVDLTGIHDPKIRQEFAKLGVEGSQKAAKTAAELASNRKIIRAIEEERNLPKGSLESFVENPVMAERITKEPKKTQASQPIDPEQLAKIQETRQNPEYAKASPSRKYQMLTDAGVSRENAKDESLISVEQGKLEEKQGIREEERKDRIRKETLSYRQELANRAEIAARGIENKEDMLKLIDEGNLDDPTVATFLESLPGKLGRRFLNPATTEYKGLLVQGYGDLKNLFSGATRVKELEILEAKLADIYLTDTQKKAVIKSMSKSLNQDLIKAEAAQEIESESEAEGKPLGILEFRKKVAERTKQKSDALFDRILDEQKAIVQDAENIKKMPLNLSDPEHKEIIKQFLDQNDRNPEKAKKAAQKAGYTW